MCVCRKWKLFQSFTPSEWPPFPLPAIHSLASSLRKHSLVLIHCFTYRASTYIWSTVSFYIYCQTVSVYSSVCYTVSSFLGNGVCTAVKKLRTITSGADNTLPDQQFIAVCACYETCPGSKTANFFPSLRLYEESIFKFFHLRLPLLNDPIHIVQYAVS